MLSHGRPVAPTPTKYDLCSKNNAWYADFKVIAYYYQNKIYWLLHNMDELEQVFGIDHNQTNYDNNVRLYFIVHNCYYVFLI